MNIIEHCDWNSPGHDPYTGSAADALSHYDMPDTTRRRLADRIERRDYDRVVSATRDGVTGYAGMRNMHFGKDRMCNRVDTSKWGANDVQLGFVYIENGHHIVKWFICKNITELVPNDAPDAPVALAQAVPEAPYAPQDFGGLASEGQVVTLPPEGDAPLVPNSLPPVLYSPPAWAPTPPVAPVPEGSVWELLVLGLLLIFMLRSRAK